MIVLLLLLVPFEERHMEPVTLKVGFIGSTHLYATHLDTASRMRLCKALRKATMPERPTADDPEWKFTTWDRWEESYERWVEQIMIRGYIEEPNRWWLHVEWQQKVKVFRSHGFDLRRK